MNKLKLSLLPGYMALTTAIMISVVIAMVGLSLASISLFGRGNGLSATQKQKSLYAAQGCLEQALLNFSLNNTYAGNETVAIQSGGETLSCTIFPLTTETTNKVIKAQAIVGSSTTNLVLKVNATTLTRVSLDEVTTLP